MNQLDVWKLFVFANQVLKLGNLGSRIFVRVAEIMFSQMWKKLRPALESYKRSEVDEESYSVCM